MPGQVEGKVALVTGAGSGIGRATAMTFASEGAAVVVADVNPEGGEETAGMVNGSGGEALFVEMDVSKVYDVEAMVAKAVEAYGRLDCAVNNAGIGTPVRARVHELPEDAWEQVIDVNLKGVWLCMKYEISRMLSQGGGSIVNMASIAGLVGVSNSAAYTASKHGVVGLTKVAALEYAEQGIKVNAVCPGYIRTPALERSSVRDPDLVAGAVDRHPIGRLGEPDEIAKAVVWLCSDAASFVIGQAMSVDGGYVAQ